MKKGLTGPQFFLRCAFPCAEDRLHARLINQEDYDGLRSLVESGEEPDKSFLEKCFPTATAEMREWCQSNGGNPWDIKNVEEFWYNHHRRKGDCAFALFRVIKVEDEVVYVGDDFPAQNLYHLPDVKVGDMFWVHRRVIVQKYRRTKQVNATPKG